MSQPPASAASTRKAAEMKRAVLLSCLCSLALILALLLAARLFSSSGNGNGNGLGNGTGMGDGFGTDGTGGSGTGNGAGLVGDANGTSTGTGAGGDASGDASVAGTANGTVDGKGLTDGAAATAEDKPGQPDGQTGGETIARATENSTAQAGSARAASTPPPVPLKPADGVRVMALGNQNFNDQSASVGTGAAAGGSGPAFFGSRGRGTRFVYIVDRSGSMAGQRFAAAQEELIKSIHSLRTGMSFHIIFFDDLTEEMPGNPLVPATVDSVAKAIKFVENMPVRGGTDPTRALERALELKPHTIWLLTDGEFQDASATVAAIDHHNAERKVAINTIAFHEKANEPLLKKIAADNHGDYRYVPPPAGGGGPKSGLSSFDQFFNKGLKPATP